MLSYRDLSDREFARLTVLTLDLDPTYVAAARVQWEEDKKLRWCAAMMAFYHTGYASEACDLEGDAFWSYLWGKISAPRPAERRHFRGVAAEKALISWRNDFGTPERFMAACMKNKFLDILGAGIPQVGTYFAWKAADYRESIFGYSMDWTDAEKHMVGLPISGLELMFPGEKPEHSIWRIADMIGDLPAPPQFSRTCGVESYETIACMIKSYRRGKNVGADIMEKRRDLEAVQNENAKELLSHMPPDPVDADFPRHL